VGAGTGDVSYLTLRGKDILAGAKVLIYDALVDQQLLNLVPSDCLKLNMGKRGGIPSASQEKINQLLVDYWREGKQVVRLKAGDPFIFGRSQGEIEAIINAGGDVEVVPGISSALAAPLLAGIPLTDTLLSNCFAVVSAHAPETLDWEALARLDTLVILMGGKTLSQIVTSLLLWRSTSTPVAIIRHCSRPSQQVWIGTLADIVQKTAGVSLSPAVIVIGEVVNLRTMPNYSAPLQGKTILVTRAAEQSSKFTQLLQGQGATVVEMPALEIRPPSSWEKLDQVIASLKDFSWLILTSANGVEYFFGRLKAKGLDSRALAGVKIAVVGKKTATYLQEYNLQADFIPPNFVADSLVENFPESLAGKKILFPRVETGGRDVLVKELTAQNAIIVEVPAYESCCPEQIEPLVWEYLQRGRVDIITFASSKTVHNFYQLVSSALKDTNGGDINSILEGVYLASIGPETSKACYQLFGRIDIEAKEYTLDGLSQAILEQN
jgi:uroporphyrinogen III methyltransferase/synthase